MVLGKLVLIPAILYIRKTNVCQTNFYSNFILYFNPNYINYDFTANFKRNCCQNHSVLCFIIAIVFSLKVYDLVLKSFERKTATAFANLASILSADIDG